MAGYESRYLSAVKDLESIFTEIAREAGVSVDDIEDAYSIGPSVFTGTEWGYFHDLVTDADQSPQKVAAFIEEQR